MRVLLDENLDWRLKRDLPGHDVESVPLLGWAEIQNGALLRKCRCEWLCCFGDNGQQLDFSTKPFGSFNSRVDAPRTYQPIGRYPAANACCLQVLPTAPKEVRTIIQ